MSTAQRRLGYVMENNSLADVSSMSGISESKLTTLFESDTALSRSDDLAIRATYQREAYARMRDAGFSSAQASRFKWYTPEAARERETSVRDKIETLTKGTFAAMSAKLDRAGEDYDPELLYYESEESVYEGFRKSKEPYERWMDY